MKKGKPMRTVERDEGTPERRQHDPVTVETRLDPDSRRVIGARVETQDPLDRYRARGSIDDRQWKAGDRLRAIHAAALFPTIHARDYRDNVVFDKVRGARDPVLPRQAALDQFRTAVAATGNVLALVVLHVCCHEGSATEWAAGKGWPRPKDGMVALRLGLDTLALHFGY